METTSVHHNSSPFGNLINHPCPSSLYSGENETNGSFSQDGTDDNTTFPDPMAIMHIRVIIIIVYTFVFVCCVFGNLLVMFVILKHRKMRTITNFFLANLAVADLCVGVFCVLPNLSTFLFPYWLLGQVMCKLYYFVQQMSYQASVTIMTVISMERYMAILYPIKSKQQTTMCRLRVAIIVIWLMTALYCIPPLYVYDTIEVAQSNGSVATFCITTHMFNLQAYVTANFILWYIIPLALMTVMYAKISVVLWTTSKSGATMMWNKQKQQMNKSMPQGYRGMQLTGLHNKSKEARAAVFPTEDDGSLVSKNIETDKETYIKFEDKDVSYEIENDLKNENETEPDFEEDWPASTKSSSTYVVKKNGLLGEKRKNGSRNGHDLPDSTGNSKESKFTMYRKQKGNALTARRKVIRLLVCVIGSFTVCVLPYHVRVLWQHWGQVPDNFSLGHVLFTPITFLIYYFNCGLNPFLYAFLSDNFRKSMKEALGCYRKKNSNRNYSTKTFQSSLTTT